LKEWKICSGSKEGIKRGFKITYQKAERDFCVKGTRGKKGTVCYNVRAFWTRKRPVVFATKGKKWTNFGEMVAYESPTTQTNYRTPAMAVTDPHGSSASVSSAVPVQEWRSHSEGGGIVGNKLAGWPGNMQVLQVPSLAAPKSESLHLYGEGEDESTAFDYSLLHGRKRSKLHDSLPAAAVIQVTNCLLSVDTICCFPMYNAAVCTMSYFRFSLCIS
jgi:hypothetical protein